jgi:hypothetical protein
MEAELYRSRVYFFHKHRGKNSARFLKTLIYAMTLAKIVFHGFLRTITRGRRGRAVTSWRELRLSLTDVDPEFEERGAS